MRWAGALCAMGCVLVAGACATEDAIDSGDGGATADGGGEARGATDGGASDAKIEDGASADADAAPPEPAVRYVGRFDTTDPSGPKVAWPGARVIVRFSGTALVAKTTEAGSQDNGPSRYDVLVDGVARPTPFGPPNGAAETTVVSGLAPGDHVVELHRRTESLVGVTQFRGFAYPNGGKLLAPDPTPLRKIEFIGDSSSNGYGVECANSSQGFTGATQNERKSYPWLATQALAADHVNVSFSGKGVARNYNAGDNDVLAILYTRTLPETPGSAWAFGTWAPDVVWLTAGGNDFGTPVGPPPAATFKAKYHELVTLIRTKNPKAHIVCSVPSSLNDDYPPGVNAYTTMTTALEQIVAERKVVPYNDPKVFYHEMPRADESGAAGAPDLTGCEFHSNTAHHQKLAKDVAAKIKAVTGWP